MPQQRSTAELSPRILIVEDEPFQRALIRQCLEVAGFDCAEAENGDDGVEQCIALRPDLVILDVLMPGRDGFSVCAEIKSRPETRSTPVLMITGFGDVDSVERSLEAGATNFLEKPINFSLLPYTLKYMLRASKMERQIREAQQLAEESSQTKSLFLANMSHELRTPLNAVLGFSELIYTEALGTEGYPKYLEYAKAIHQGADHLLQIINDILDLSKINSDQLELHEGIISFAEVIEQAVGMVQDRAQQEEVHLEVDLDQDLPKLRTDALRIKQVLINLIDNSIKFTPAGGTVSIRARLQEDGQFAVIVQDTGIGISSDQMDRALSPFGQVDCDLNRKYEGTGLGLSISKRLAGLLGADFTIESEIDRGTSVTLRFPQERVCKGSFETIKGGRKLAS